MAQANVLFFGPIADLFGAERLVELPEGSTVADLRRLLAAEHGAIASPSIRAAVGRQVAEEGTPVLAGAEIAFFSPVSGG